MEEGKVSSNPKIDDVDAFKLVDPVFLAMSKLQRRRFDECIDICTRILKTNPYDKVRW